ncbi:YciI family protein [Phenylobacterium sp.]|uniref:YciI family protein n=1 Tax=Phenylobacterium sp. TaxID=1871053 RepID=UPI002E31E5E7|nr:YciI family protein [Phenylobacterium sp.]HEX2560230.1 YciI family protein [Phenylobacterium sp.]
MNEAPSMLYAILCYDSEDVVGAWTKEEDEAAIKRLEVVEEKLARQGRLGPVARLLPTTAATTIRKGREAMVIDGPFAETKEQLLGFFIVECASLDDAIETAKELGKASSSAGSFEVRPLAVFKPHEVTRADEVRA